MDWVADSLIDSILKWFAGIIVGALNALWDLLSSTVFVSPDVTLLPQVRAFSSTSLGIVNTAYVLAILWMAILVMGRDTIQSRYGPGELIPRLVIGLIAANLSLPLCSTMIELANAITQALTKQDITAPGSMQHMRNIVTGSLQNQTGNSPASFLLLLIGLIIAVLVGTLLVQWIIRLGILIIAVGVAPIALALHGTPQTEGAAKLWWRTILGTLGTVVLQAVSLHTALSIFLNPGSNLPMLGIPGDPGAAMNLFIVLCMLWAVIKIPGLMRRYITKTPPSQAGTILRVVLIQQLTSAIRGGLSRGRGPGRTGGARMPGSPHPSGGAGWPTGKPQPGRPHGGTGGWDVHKPRHGGPPPQTPKPQPAPKTPAGAGPGVVGTAWPSGRPVKPYTPEELREGVDVYTRSRNRRSGAANGRTT